MTAPDAPTVARGGAIPGAVGEGGDPPRPGATGGHGARLGADDGSTASGASMADGGTVGRRGGGASCQVSDRGPGAPSRACAREIEEGGVSPADASCPHPEDARGSDPYEAGRVRCLACGSSWEAHP